MKSRKNIVIAISILLVPLIYELLGEHLIGLPIAAKGIIFICYTAVVLSILKRIS